MLTPHQQARLDTIYNRTTRYEITATHEDGRKFLVGYTIHKSRSGLLATMRKRPDQLATALGLGDSEPWTFKTKPLPRATVAGWTIGFTGRTERDAIIEGEIPTF